MVIFINPPDAEEFKPSSNLQDIMGTWYVTHSTLPMWKSKKDVTITYSPIAGDATRFDDVVEYRALSESPQKNRTKIVGIDTLVAPEGTPSVRFKWRGRGWLVIASSRWQLLGYGNGSGEEEDEPAWAVTFFEKTLFTPAGLDIYARTSAGLPAALIEQIKSGLAALGGQVADLAGQVFIGTWITAYYGYSGPHFNSIVNVSSNSTPEHHWERIVFLADNNPRHLMLQLQQSTRSPRCLYIEPSTLFTMRVCWSISRLVFTIFQPRRHRVTDVKGTQQVNMELQISDEVAVLSGRQRPDSPSHLTTKPSMSRNMSTREKIWTIAGCFP